MMSSRFSGLAGRKKNSLANPQMGNYLLYNNNEPITLTNCDKEPIHVIGSIQDQGFMFIVDEDYVIIHTSTNVKRFLQFEWNEVIGRPLLQLIPGFTGTYENLREYGASEIYQAQEMNCDVKRKDGTAVTYHLSVHINVDKLLVIEAEELIEDSFEDYGQRIGNLFKIFSEQQDLYAILEMVAKEVQEVGGYSRVMIYEFDKDYQGRVIIEKTDMDSRFLGLHFPSTDIPAQARRLFIKNRFRIMEDVNTVPTLIMPQTRNIDLTYSILRSASPIHVQYLNNMGVRGSLTISIVIGREKKLWGMIVSHNYHHRRNISFAKRKYCDMLGKVLSIQVENILQRRGLAQRIFMDNKLSRIREALTEVNTDYLWEDIVAPLLPNIAELLECDGVVIKIKDDYKRFGQIGASFDEIKDWIQQNAREAKYHVSESTLADMGIEPTDGLSCGVLYMVLTAKDVGIYFFRNELIRSIIWAGEPKKQDVFGMLTPRASFNQWKETKKGTSAPWSEEHIEYALQIQSIITRFIFRWTADKLKSDAEKEKEAKEALLREQQVILQSAAVHNNFLATVSHELRTPIHSIMGNTERLGDMINTKLQPDAVQCCKMIQSSGEHLLAIISDILDLTKLESNKIEISPILMDFYKKIESIIQSFFSLARNKGLYIVALVPVGLPPIYADPTRLGQILLNFISNAVKFTTVGGVVLSIDLVEKTHEAVELSFKVIDTGPGISEAGRLKLFERFHQLEGGRTRRFDGSGLGLAISKQLVALMGGTIGVDSADSLPNHSGTGSVFWAKMKIPLKDLKNPGNTSATSHFTEKRTTFNPSNEEVTNDHPESYSDVKIFREDPNAVVICFETRYFVKAFLSHYMKQWKVGKVVFALSLTPPVVLDLVQNYKNIKVAFFQLASPEDEDDGHPIDQIKTAQEVLKKHCPNIKTIVIEPSDSQTPKDIEDQYDGVLRLPLSLIDLHEYLEGHKDGNNSNNSSSEAAEAEVKKSPKQVLLVEDNKLNQYIGIAFLKGLGHEVDVAENGAIAVRAVKRKFYDVVLMDVMMPVMDGITATMQIRNEEQRSGSARRLKIVALTAVSESTLVEECIKSGMDTCLFKPFKKEELAKLLDSINTEEESAAMNKEKAISSPQGGGNNIIEEKK
eukprot:TRINITY_DN972_c0_g1_i1.p1 TRINITY_DN972_c0_g1~~TRINITY_DN972_c0_g1_i1.p1  ORF type:complete len:1140 (-),score=268.77 TRINITY_DN972_c0_g1_i1:30-3449(-)